MRNEKGITLIALILIIVVLLILAGISISLVVSNEADNIVIEPEDKSLTNMVSMPVDEEENVTSDDSQNVVTPENETVENEVTENTVAENTVDENTVETNQVAENTVEPENVVE